MSGYKAYAIRGRVPDELDELLVRDIELKVESPPDTILLTRRIAELTQRLCVAIPIAKRSPRPSRLAM